MFSAHPASGKLVIGVLTPCTGGFYYGAALAGILETAQAHDAIAIVFETSRLRLLHESAAGREVLASSWVDGWLAINEFSDAPLTAELRARGQPLIHVHAKPESPTGCAVLPDNLGGMRAVTEHLIQHGHRRIAFAGNLNHVDVGERFDGYCAALRANGITIDTALVFDTLHHKEADGRNVAEQLLARRASDPNAALPVSALVAATDRLALGAIAGFTQAGISLPQEIAIVGFDDTGAAQLAEPALTTVKQSFTEVAARAVVELLNALRQGTPLPNLVRVPTQPIIRRSCGCAISHSLPPQIPNSETDRARVLSRELRVLAGRTRMREVTAAEWPDADKISEALDEACRQAPTTSRSVMGEWWAPFLALNPNPESVLRAMELLDVAARAWAQQPDEPQIRGLLRDLRVAVMLQWQRSERVTVAHYEAVSEAAYRLMSALARPGSDPARDLSWIRWAQVAHAHCALWSRGNASMAPARSMAQPQSWSKAAPPASTALRLVGEYTAEEGSLVLADNEPSISPSQFPRADLLHAAHKHNAVITIASIPRGRGGEYGIIAVTTTLEFEQLEYVGTPSDWAQQLGASLDRAQTETELRASAEQDPLTGLANRATLLQRVEALRIAPELPGFALLNIDLDDFRKVNDSLGHEAGDQLLMQIAERLQDEVATLTDALGTADPFIEQRQPTLARLGGDEFVIVVSGLDTEAHALAIAESIQHRLKQPYTLQGNPIFVSASIGVNFARGTTFSAQELLRDADTALYRAKVHGRARHEVFHHGMHAQAVEKLHLDARLRQALESNELELWYQPIVGLRSNRDVGAEALIRWRHPELGLLSPARFISVAEEVGLAIPISEWVIRRACAEAARWQLPGMQPLYVNVNVPAAHVKQPGFAEFIENTLAAYQLNPRAFGVEIVESTVMDDPARCTAALARLLAKGVRVAIDDFGTGYSSLSYLRDFPASTLKIDRSFVQGIPHNVRDNGITKAIVAMGQGLGLTVVAEGVETREQLQFLQQSGCDYAQGYFLSHPLELADYVERVMSQRSKEAPSSRRALGSYPIARQNP